VEILFYDPVLRHQTIEKMVVREGSYGQEKKYWRFRSDRWYGGIATADCVGCGLLCYFCWIREDVRSRPVEVGKFYTPKQVAELLMSIAQRKGFNQVRVSGGEPAIGKKHLLQLLDNFQGKTYRFVLETNGIPIAYDSSYAKDLSHYPFIHVRVSLKGSNEMEFSMLTGAKPEGFQLQLKALENLEKANVSYHAACMVSFSTDESREPFLHRLGTISPRLAEEFEVEELILYPSVQKRLREYGLKYYTAYSPRSVPQELI
jgi:uncharacterized Fe-S cluster-containing radical SAM superfamily protein